MHVNENSADKAAPYKFCDPAGTRTQGPYIKSVLLYQLSYGIIPYRFLQRGAKIQSHAFRAKTFSNYSVLKLRMFLHMA